MAGVVDPYTGQQVKPYQNAPIPVNNSDTLANHAYHVAVNQLKDQRAETTSYYGMGAKGAIDPNNPYGQRQLLERSQGQGILDLTGAQQQGGLLGVAGSGNQGIAKAQQNNVLFSQGQETAQMLKEFQDRLHSIRLGKTEALWQKGEKETSGTLQAIMNAIAAGSFTPAAPYGG